MMYSRCFCIYPLKKGDSRLVIPLVEQVQGTIGLDRTARTAFTIVMHET
ncbi:MAG: hypothetical protein NTW33_12070 [Methanoregula sp.]|nr:hypothetical protein [Methanoregula sp.]